MSREDWWRVERGDFDPRALDERDEELQREAEERRAFEEWIESIAAAAAHPDDDPHTAGEES